MSKRAFKAALISKIDLLLEEGKELSYEETPSVTVFHIDNIVVHRDIELIPKYTLYVNGYKIKFRIAKSIYKKLKRIYEKQESINYKNMLSNTYNKYLK